MGVDSSYSSRVWSYRREVMTVLRIVKLVFEEEVGVPSRQQEMQEKLPPTQAARTENTLKHNEKTASLQFFCPSGVFM